MVLRWVNTAMSSGEAPSPAFDQSEISTTLEWWLNWKGVRSVAGMIVCLQNVPHRERLRIIIYLACQKQEYGIDFNIRLKHLKPHNFHKVKKNQVKIITLLKTATSWDCSSVLRNLILQAPKEMFQFKITLVLVNSDLQQNTPVTNKKTFLLCEDNFFLTWPFYFHKQLSSQQQQCGVCTRATPLHICRTRTHGSAFLRKVSQSRQFAEVLLPMKTQYFMGTGLQASLIALAAPAADCFLLLFFPGALRPLQAHMT